MWVFFFLVCRFESLSSVTFSLKIFPSISYKAGLLAVNPLVYLSGNVFHSPLSLKGSFVGYKICGIQWCLLPLLESQLSFQCLLAPIISDEKSAVNLHGVVSYGPCHFYLATLKVFFVYLSTLVSGCRYMCICPPWSLLSVLDIEISFLNQIWEVSAIFSSSISSVPLSLSSDSGTPVLHIL